VRPFGVTELGVRLNKMNSFHIGDLVVIFGLFSAIVVTIRFNSIKLGVATLYISFILYFLISYIVVPILRRSELGDSSDPPAFIIFLILAAVWSGIFAFCAFIIRAALRAIKSRRA
jgi:hypothetical protein